MDPIMKE